MVRLILLLYAPVKCYNYLKIFPSIEIKKILNLAEKISNGGSNISNYYKPIKQKYTGRINYQPAADPNTI